MAQWCRIEGQVSLNGLPVHFGSPLDPRKRGIETVYQDLAVAPALDIATNLFWAENCAAGEFSVPGFGSGQAQNEDRGAERNGRIRSFTFPSLTARWKTFPVDSVKG